MSDKTRKYLRLGALVALIGGLYLAGNHSALAPYFEVDYLRSLTTEAGAAGMATFVALFCAGYLMQIPGMIFVVLALVGWGPWGGGILALGASILATILSFGMVRSVGGSPLEDVENRWARKLLDQIDERPVRTTFVLRVVFYMNPLINVPLVLSGIRFRDYLVGSALGFILPLGVVMAGLDFVLRWLNL